MECEVYRDQMLDVLYGEADTESARQVEEHQSACEACREEMASLRHVRRDLRAWTLPPLPVRRAEAPASRLRPLAMAAGLLLAAGAALGLSGSEVSYHNGELAFRLGRGPAAPDVQAKLADLEAKVQALNSRPAATPVLLSAPAAPPTDFMAAVDRKIRENIQESEKRTAAAYSADFADFQARQAAQMERQFTAIKAFLAYEAGRSALRQASYTSDASLAR